EGHECVLLAAEMNGHADLPIKEEDFASPPNRTIFQSIRQLKDQDREHGLLAVQDHLQRQRKLTEIGGPARLTEIFCLPTDEANVRYVLGEVLEASRNRQAIEIGTR